MPFTVPDPGELANQIQQMREQIASTTAAVNRATDESAAWRQHAPAALDQAQQANRTGTQLAQQAPGAIDAARRVGQGADRVGQGLGQGAVAAERTRKTLLGAFLGLLGAGAVVGGVYVATRKPEPPPEPAKRR